MGPNAIVVRATRAGPRHDAAMALLAGGRRDAAAGPSDGGEVFALCDLGASPRETPLAAALTVAVAATSVELRLLATSAEGRRRRAEPRLLTGIVDALRADGVARLLAAADESQPRLVLCLQAAGFRPCRRHPDFVELEL